MIACTTIGPPASVKCHQKVAGLLNLVGECSLSLFVVSWKNIPENSGGCQKGEKGQNKKDQILLDTAVYIYKVEFP